MSADTEKLIAELRRIAKVGFGYDITKGDRIALTSAADRIAALEKALAEAREALAPFAELGADEGHEDHPDETPAIIKVGRVTDFSMHLSDFRRAAALSNGGRG
jgi:hypothetical protein